MATEEKQLADGAVWKEGCANKEQKKRALSGELMSAGGNVGQKSCQRKQKQASDVGNPIESLSECFSDVVDPRVNRRRRHLLIDIIVIAVLAVIANADTWKDIHIWGATHKAWLGSFLSLPNGVPSRDTLRRTISRIDPQALQNAFLRWLREWRKDLRGVIAIDGKTLRGSRLGDQSPLHIVSAWASEQHLTLGQRQVDDKSNEITAIPELLKTLVLKGAIVTIDAMGCQKDIAAGIIKGQGRMALPVGSFELRAICQRVRLARRVASPRMSTHRRCTVPLVRTSSVVRLVLRLQGRIMFLTGCVAHGVKGRCVVIVLRRQQRRLIVRHVLRHAAC